MSEATCATHGHLYGASGNCLFCAAVKPDAMKPDEIKRYPSEWIQSRADGTSGWWYRAADHDRVVAELTERLREAEKLLRAVNTVIAYTDARGHYEAIDAWLQREEST